MIPKTKFLEVLEDIHKKTDMRYGQIINNALQYAKGRHACDCGHDLFDCKCSNRAGAAYDTFHIYDEEFTKALEAFRDSL